MRKERDVLRPMSVVHPRVYAHRLVQANQWYKEYQEIMNLLRQGGQFSAKIQPNGSLTIERIST